MSTRPGESKIVVDQGSRTNEFIITGHSGAWTNVSTAGSVAFTVTYDSVPGTITVERNGEGTAITIDMTNTGGGVKRKIIVDQIITE